MKFLLALLGAVAVVLGLRYASDRVALYRPVLPTLSKRINTQVHRINQ